MQATIRLLKTMIRKNQIEIHYGEQLFKLFFLCNYFNLIAINIVTCFTKQLFNVDTYKLCIYMIRIFDLFQMN